MKKQPQIQEEGSPASQGYNENNINTHKESPNDNEAIPPSSNQDRHSTSTSKTQYLGSSLSSFSDFINDNLIIARYGTFATITLLTAYGLSQTPIFFRYKKICDIPRYAFANRYTIHGRIINVVENDVIQLSKWIDDG